MAQTTFEGQPVLTFTSDPVEAQADDQNVATSDSRNTIHPAGKGAGHQAYNKEPNQ